MLSLRSVFHLISYAQYLFIGVALYFDVLFVWGAFNQVLDWDLINSMLVYMGIAISFSTLQDTQKTQNALSLRVWQNPTQGRFFLAVLGLSTLTFMVLGLVGMTLVQESVIKEVAFGMVVLGIGMLGMTKAASEMFEHHRLDRHPPAPSPL